MFAFKQANYQVLVFILDVFGPYNELMPTQVNTYPLDYIRLIIVYVTHPHMLMPSTRCSIFTTVSQFHPLSFRVSFIQL